MERYDDIDDSFVEGYIDDLLSRSRRRAITRVAAGAVAALLLIRGNHSVAASVSIAAAACAWEVHREVVKAMTGKSDRPRQARPLLVLTAKTTPAWLLLAAALWAFGW